MYIYLSKILPLMVLPIGIVIELLLMALLLLWWGKRKSSAFFMVAAIFVLWCCSMPIVANTVLGKLEQRYPALALSDVPSSDCIVLLGGALDLIRPPRVDVNLLDSVDRISKTASLYRAGKAAVVIVSGGNQPWQPQLKSEAKEIQTLLTDWGVPVSAIVLEETSRNTRENAVNTKVLLDKLECQTPLLVTSAAHMSRSVATFTKLEMDVFPVSADVRAVNTIDLTVFDFIPDTRALAMTTNAIREWTGQMIYRLRGWI